MPSSNASPSLESSGFTYLPPYSRWGLVSSTVPYLPLKELPDGRLLLAGQTPDYSGNETWYFTATVLNADGVLDETFGDGGSLFWKIDPAVVRAGFAVGAELTESGSLIVLNGAGLPPPAYGSGLILSRFDAYGQMDSTFGDAGITIALGNSFGRAYLSPSDLLVEPDGAIWVAGTLSDFQVVDPGSIAKINHLIVQLKFRSDGQLDANFPWQDYVIPTSTFAGELFDIEQLPGGVLRVITTLEETARGRSFSGPVEVRSYELTRQENEISPWIQASLEVIEGQTPSGGIAGLRAWARLPDERWVKVSAQLGQHWIERRLPDGSLDPSFNLGAPLKLPVLGIATWVEALHVEANGNYLLEGRIERPALSVGQPRQVSRFILRIDSNGHLDNSFGGSGGVFETEPKPGGSLEFQGSFTVFNNGVVPALLPLSDGGIIWSGVLYRPQATESAFDWEERWHVPAVGKLTGEGKTDATFGGTPEQRFEQFMEGGLPSQLNLFLKPREQDGVYAGSVIEIARADGPSSDDVFTGLGSLVFSGSKKWFRKFGHWDKR